MAARDTGKRKQANEMAPNSPELSPGPDGDFAPGVRMEPDLQAHIGRQLRAVYDEVVNEPVPDKFVRLLEELERKQAKGS
jgi:hypothetical protein